MTYEIAKSTNQGPREHNEDAIAVWELADGGVAAAIADGLGAMGGGNIAAEMATHSLSSKITESNISSAKLEQTVREIQKHLEKKQRENDHLSKMATTLTAAIFSKNEVTGVHVGDTRAVIVRRRGIKRLTTEHSEAQRLFEAGKLTKGQMLDYPRRHILESAIGADSPLRIDTFCFDVQPGDKFLFTTDGVHSLIRLQEMYEIAKHHDKPKALVEAVVAEVENRNVKDNYSIVAVHVSASTRLL